MESQESEAPGRGAAAPSPQTTTSRREQFLIARKPGPPPLGVEPLDLEAVKAALERDPEVSIKRTLTPSGLGPLGAGLSAPPAVIVAAMPRERAEQMSRVPQLLVEPDHRLMLADPLVPSICDPGVVVPHAAGPTVTITATGKDRAPVEGANVFLFSELWPAQAVTDADGTARVTLVAESVDAVRGLYVKPRSDYWSLWLAEPALDPNRPNPVALTPLDQTFPKFPSQEVIGWGLKAMRVDQLPANYRGQGVRVAVVDSGIAKSHQDLQSAVKGGYDAAAQNADTWDRDEVGHGSHCAGIIAGRSDGRGIRGIAPDCELFGLKVFPGGRLSTLIDALDRCVELQVDLVNLSLANDQPSELLEEKIRELKELGIACIVAAGSSADAVKYPASSPHALAVAAVGKRGEFPSDSYHGTEIWEGGVDGAEEYFSARFTCTGPEIDVCAPGVAILSCVPPNNYAVWDGTSTAAPHVAGLAALILAHHPDFQGPFKARSAERVDRLFQILRQSARPLNLGDPNRTGAGMPDAINALLLPQPELQALRTDELLQRLLAVLEGRQTAPEERATVVQQVLSALQRAGVAQAPPQGAVDARVALKQLRGSMQQAGLLPSKGRRAALRAWQRAAGGLATATSGHGSSARAGASSEGGNGWPMQQLTETMRHVGLL